MIEDFVGPENFRNGITDYLNEMRYENADSEDLLRNLKKHSELDILPIVNTWIRQKGIPVVSVERVNNVFQLTQKRFLTDPENEGKETVESEYKYRWSIPVTYRTNLNENVSREWYLHQMDKLVIDPGNVTWIKFNVDQVGYYRVRYEQSMWESLTEALKVNIDALSILDRAHLLNDVFSLAQAQQVEYATALGMTEFLQGEVSFIPWSVAATKLKKIRDLLYNTEYYTKFKKYVNKLVDGAFKSIDWNIDPDAHLNK
jgi:glutamyl aminopeptidase